MNGPHLPLIIAALHKVVQADNAPTVVEGERLAPTLL